MTLSYLILLIQPAILAAAFLFLLIYSARRPRKAALQPAAMPEPRTPDDEDDSSDEGGLPEGWDFPLDLPPGVFVLPPAPEPVHA